MSDRGWKQAERRLARDVGTERIPVTGERAGADFQDAAFAYQCKLGRRFPTYLVQWLRGIAHRSDGRTGVVVWKAKGGRDAEALVCLRWSDWVDLHGATTALVSQEKRPQALHGPICERPGCGCPLPTIGAQHGSRRRFCSPRCRRLAWRATHARRAKVAA